MSTIADVLSAGVAASRPASLAAQQAGWRYYETDTQKEFYWDGAAWKEIVTGGGSVSGALLKASNLSDLANAATARGNLGLGTMAVETATDYLTKAGNLSGIANAATARGN